MINYSIKCAREKPAALFKFEGVFKMEAIIGLIVQLVAGGAGGNVVGQMLKGVSLGPTGNSVAGAVGGLGGAFLAGLVPGLDGLVSSMSTGGGMDFGALAGTGVASLVGGGALTAIAGFVKNTMMKS